MIKKQKGKRIKKENDPVKLEVVVENGHHILYAGPERLNYLVETIIKDRAGEALELTAEIMVNSDNKTMAAKQLVFYKGVLFTPQLKIIDCSSVHKKMRAPGEDFDRVYFWARAIFALRPKPGNEFTKDGHGPNYPAPNNN